MKAVPWLDDTVAANGLPVCRNFAAWFGQSKAVNPDGSPLLLYHGTMADITAFHGGQDNATYFTPSSVLAVGFANDSDRGWEDQVAPVVMPVYISVANPRVITWEELQELAGNDEGWIEWTAMTSVVHDARNAGHDGIHLVDVREYDGSVNDQWLTFRPHQVKSALGNSGLYCPDNKAIDDLALAQALLRAHRARDAVSHANEASHDASLAR